MCDYTKREDGGVIVTPTQKSKQDNQMREIEEGGARIAYDMAGNELQPPLQKTGDFAKSYRLKWDAWNRLVEVEDKNEIQGTRMMGAGVALCLRK